MVIEDQHLDFLQNIEFGIVSVYREHPMITDYEVMRALEAIIDKYIAEKIEREPRDFRLDPVETKIYKQVTTTCDWRLGHSTLGDKSEENLSPKSIDEIIQCLKRILKSVKHWNKKGGRTGYLNFVSQYIK